jgi:hypothetical protein
MVELRLCMVLGAVVGRVSMTTRWSVVLAVVVALRLLSVRLAPITALLVSTEMAPPEHV